MGTFDVHSDINDLPFVRSEHGNEALGLFYSCGSWARSHESVTVIPSSVVERLSRGRTKPVQVLVDAGLWEQVEAGYRMLRGPSPDLDDGLPLWRFSDDDLDGRLFAIDDGPNT